MEKVGAFSLSINLFEENRILIPIFKSFNFNMPKEVLMAQLKAFLKNIEDNYNGSFKDNITTISGKPDN